jgi:2-polyprenyl-3-methyl-5-hydroxy-6-metoxy-1,4-benzoquinol methylase
MEYRKKYIESLMRFALRFRRARFKLFEDLVADFGGRSVNILDVGGFEEFWVNMGFDLQKHSITVLNLESEWKPSTHDRVKSVVGDACDMKEYKRGDFDIVFSNSVIEHVGVWDRQRQMADEVRRLADCYFVQTPNYYFPMEPHFHVPFFQAMPLGVRQRLIQNFALGCMPKIPDAHEARKLAEETRLLTKREMKKLFPDARVEEEKLLGMTKSIICIRRAPNGRKSHDYSVN